LDKIVVDREWQLRVLREFTEAAGAVETHTTSLFSEGKKLDAAHIATMNDLKRVANSKQVLAEVALDQLIADWRALRPTGLMKDELAETQKLAERAIVMAEQADELALHAAPPAPPTVEATGLHEWVWEGARRQWGHGDYDTAVHHALDEVLREIQVKTGYEDSGEGLFTKVFAPKEPARPAAPRLRVLGGAHAKNAENRQLGAQYLGQACIKAIRNPGAHLHRDHLNRQQALELLAMLSVLARWCDEATVDRGPDTTVKA